MITIPSQNRVLTNSGRYCSHGWLSDFRCSYTFSNCCAVSEREYRRQIVAALLIATQPFLSYGSILTQALWGPHLNIDSTLVAGQHGYLKSSPPAHRYYHKSIRTIAPPEYFSNSGFFYRLRKWHILFESAELYKLGLLKLFIILKKISLSSLSDAIGDSLESRTSWWRRLYQTVFPDTAPKLTRT